MHIIEMLFCASFMTDVAEHNSSGNDDGSGVDDGNDDSGYDDDGGDDRRWVRWWRGRWRRWWRREMEEGGGG